MDNDNTFIYTIVADLFGLQTLLVQAPSDELDFEMNTKILQQCPLCCFYVGL